MTSQNNTDKSQPRDHEQDLPASQSLRAGEAVTVTTEFDHGVCQPIHDRCDPTRTLNVGPPDFSGSFIRLNNRNSLEDEVLRSDAKRLEFTSNIQDLLRAKKLFELNLIDQSQDSRKGRPYFYKSVYPSQVLFNAPRDQESGEFPGYSSRRASESITWTENTRRMSPSDIVIPPKINEFGHMFEGFRMKIIEEDPADKGSEQQSQQQSSHLSWLVGLLQLTTGNGQSARPSDETLEVDTRRSHSGGQSHPPPHPSCASLNLIPLSQEDIIHTGGTTIDTQEETYRQEMLIRSWPWPSLTLTSDEDLRRWVSRADWPGECFRAESERHQ